MSYFDDASLVMIPSGYKDQKVYSVKPLDGSGDLTFSRASSATRVASNGLIEKVRTNVVLQSEAFNTTWATASVSVTPNTTANPLNGALTADTITLTGATTQKFITQSIIYGGSTTTSVYLKAGTHQFVQICLGGDPAPSANFDLVNGTASATNSTASIVSVGGGFFRCSMAATSIIGTDIIILAVDSLAAARFASTASTGTFIAFGAQVEVGDIATDYIATTSAAVSVGPVSGLPRLDYLNSTCPRLLLEPQRTNLLTYSSNFSSGYFNFNSTTSASTTLSPEGYLNAARLTSSSSGVIFTGVSATGTHTFSVFAKYVNQANCRLGFTDGTDYETTFNIQNGTIVSSGATLTSKIEAYPNGWYRCSITRNLTGPTPNIYFGATVLVGNFDFYGAQVEAGAYATSYIPTLGTSVTRVADAASKAGISSLIGQTEGTLFAEFNFDGRYDSNGIIPIVIRTSNNEAYIFISGAGSLLCELVVAGVPQASISGSIGAVGIKKIAFAYKQNDFVVYLNGVQIGTDISGTVGAMADLNVGSWHSSGYSTMNGINQALLFKTRLTNAQLAELTTL
jgi:hypothetical protein